MKINPTNNRPIFGKRLLKMMMRTLIFTCCFTVFSLSPGDLLSQDINITINTDKIVSVDEVFKLISDQTDYNFIYSEDCFEQISKVYLKKGKVKVSKLLEDCMTSNNLSFMISEQHTIIIKQAIFEKQQNIIVSGFVTDEQGVPLVGVTVKVKNKNLGTSTDFDGNYRIAVSTGNILVFTSLGYIKQEITVGSKNKINVALKEATNELNEVVINAGYYKTSRKLATGNIGTVKAKDIGQQPTTDPIEGLKGKIAGLQITQNDGLPGAAATVRIRGINSLNSSANLPMYILNGVPIPSSNVGSLGGVAISPLEYLNPADIESIDVLKDADATSIYGSRGANGIILITTKQGQAGETRVVAEYSHGFLKMPNLNRIDLMNTEEYLAMRRQTAENEGIWPIEESDLSNNVDLVNWDPTRDVNWREELLGDIGIQRTARLAVSGGSETTSYLFSFNLSDQTNIYNYDDSSHKQASSSLSLNHRSINDKFNVAFTSRYSITANNQNTAASSEYFRSAFTLAPNAPELLDANGNINYEGQEDDLYFQNPLAALENSLERVSRNYTGSAIVSYKNLIPNLEAKVILGYSNTLVNYIELNPLSGLNPRDQVANAAVYGRNSETMSTTNSWNVEPELAYTKSFGDHHFIMQVGAAFQSVTSKRIGVLGYGYTSDLLLSDIRAAPEQQITSNSISQYKYNALYTRLNYNYKSKYLLNLTGRRDGSSRFGPNKKFGNFGAVGASWVFSSEDFVKDNLSFLSLGKFRGSYGITGNDQIGDYQYLSTYSKSNLIGYNDILGITPSRAENPFYSWEENTKLELALDLALFNNRVNLETVWYKNHSSNQLIGLPLSRVTGFVTQQFNLPALVENRGVELTLNTTNISNTNFTWNTSFNISFEKNELKKFFDIENFPAFDNLYVVGESLYGRKQYDGTGVDPETGIYMITDVNEDGRVNVLDRQFFVDLMPDFYGGFGNNFTYKNWQLDISMSFKQTKGFDFLSSFRRPGAYEGGHGNLPVDFLDAWANPGDIAKIQQLNNSSTTYTSPLALDSSTGRHVVDKSFIKLQNVSLTYNIPKTVLDRLKFKAAKLYVRGQNLGTLTSYEGIDPETGGLGLPALLTIITGIQLTL